MMLTPRYEVPTLPHSALAIYQEMARQKGYTGTMSNLRAGQVGGAVYQGNVRFYMPEDPRRHELPQRPDHHHLSKYIPQTADAAIPQDNRGAVVELTDAQIQEIVRSDQKSTLMIGLHNDFVQKEAKVIRGCFVRLFGRRAELLSKTWDELFQAARAKITSILTTSLHRWRHENPDLQHNWHDTSGTLLDAHLRFFISSSLSKEPIPTHASPQLQKELERRHKILAMMRQRKLLRGLTTEVKNASRVRDGMQYRREPKQIIDMWTGIMEDYGTFNERNRRENTGLTADQLQLAALSPQTQEQTQTQPQNQLQAQHKPMKDVAQPHEPGQLDNAQSLMSMEEQFQETAGAHLQKQVQASDNMWMQVDGEEQSPTKAVEPLPMHAESVNATEAGTTQPTELLDPMELDDAPVEKRQESAQATVQDVLTQSQVPNPTDALEQFQAQLQAAAQAHEQETIPTSPGKSTQVQDNTPMGGISHDEDPMQAPVRTQGLVQPPADSLDFLPAQEKYELERRESSQMQTETPIAMTFEDHTEPEARVEDLNQAQLEKSVQMDPHMLSRALPQATTDTAAPGTSDEGSPIDEEEEGPIEEPIGEEAQETMQSESLDPTESEASQQAQDEAESEVQCESPTASEDPTQTERDDSSQAQSQASSHPQDTTMSEDAEGTDEKLESLASMSESPQDEKANHDSASHEDQKPATGHPGTKCNYCTKSGTRCNGERPCQFCIRYHRYCYDVGKGPPPRNKKAPRSRQATPQPQPEEQETPRQSSEASHIEDKTGAQILDNADGDGDESSQLTEEASADESTNHAHEQVQAQKPVKEPKAPKKAPAAKKTERGRTVTTRLTEKKAQEEERKVREEAKRATTRSLRSLAHRDGPKKA